MTRKKLTAREVGQEVQVLIAEYNETVRGAAIALSVGIEEVEDAHGVRISKNHRKPDIADIVDGCNRTVYFVEYRPTNVSIELEEG